MRAATDKNDAPKAKKLRTGTVHEQQNKLAKAYTKYKIQRRQKDKIQVPKGSNIHKILSSNFISVAVVEILVVVLLQVEVEHRVTTTSVVEVILNDRDKKHLKIIDYI